MSRWTEDTALAPLVVANQAKIESLEQQVAAIQPAEGGLSPALTAALVGTAGTPSALNRYVTDEDPRNSDARAPTAHQHAQADVTGLIDTLAAKSNDGHNHALAEVDGLEIALQNRALTTHQHSTGDVTGLDTALAGKAAASHAHAIGDVTNLQTTLNGKAASAHTHPQSEVTNLVTDLAGKAPTAHQHNASDINAGTLGTARLGSGTANATTFLRGDQTWAAPPAGSGTIYGVQVVLHHPHMAASAAATNLAANTFNAVSDPAFRQFVDLRGMTKIRIQGRFGGAVVAATRLRIQYHTGGNPAVVTGDAGWTTLAESAGSHTVNVLFYSAEIAIPAGAQINDCLIRCGIFGGDSAADPTLSCCILNCYP
jgi:hypothetical protein